ncbi:32491_t:CDS:2, partial [Racocetra persica]
VFGARGACRERKPKMSTSVGEMDISSDSNRDSDCGQNEDGEAVSLNDAN